MPPSEPARSARPGVGGCYSSLASFSVVSWVWHTLPSSALPLMQTSCGLMPRTANPSIKSCSDSTIFHLLSFQFFQVFISGQYSHLRTLLGLRHILLLENHRGNNCCRSYPPLCQPFIFFLLANLRFFYIIFLI